MIPQNQKAEITAFEKTTKELLQQYGVDVLTKINECVIRTGKEARKRLYNDRTYNDTGIYRQGWKVVIDKERGQSTKVIVANTGKHGALTHLLEYGHPIRNGQYNNTTWGGVEGKAHIAPVREAMQEYLIDEVEQALGEI